MMATLKRWTHGVLGTIDAMIVQVENHEGQVTTAIRELGRWVAKAKVQLKRVQRDGESLRISRDRELEARDRWRARAAREPDDGRALECLRRARQSDRHLERLETRLVEHRRGEQQLCRDVAELERRMRELTEQRNRMTTRQARAEAMAVVQAADAGLDGGLEDVFERWDTHLTTTEYETGCTDQPFDDLEEGFRTEEEDAELTEELAELRRNR
jgi:phage shock protein A